jgi:dTDP-4-dehydrorhamnose 3,5-epimerase
MTIQKITIQDSVIINPEIFEDSSEFFYEAYNTTKCNENGINFQFIQDNQSFCKLKGVHELYLQINPLAQVKPASVLQAGILDVGVDLSEKSPIYEQLFNVVLFADNKKKYLYEN